MLEFQVSIVNLHEYNVKWKEMKKNKKINKKILHGGPLTKWKDKKFTTALRMLVSATTFFASKNTQIDQ